MQWESVIGLEIHVQLATQSKIFSGAATRYGAEPNTPGWAVYMAQPWVLPVLNAEAVRMAVLFGLAIDAEIAPVSVFARKNYFYPDLPKGYQISQYEQPIVGLGHLDIEVDGETKRIGVTRAHLEEDAGKSLHEDFHGHTGIDLNRAGTPLLEVVSEPELRSAAEAVAYMRKLHELVRYLKICDGNMQEGSFRCDANVSVRRKGESRLGTRAEVKNVNSFKFVEKAIDYEIERQIELIESGGQVVQETRLYDPDKDQTRSMRSKEEANDYRYFPDPDLLPVAISEDFKATIKNTLPELPDAKRQRFSEQYGLDMDTVRQLTDSRELADYFEQAVTEAGSGQAKLVANWLTGELLAALNKAGVELAQVPLKAQHLGGLVKRIADNTVSGKIAKQVFERMWQSGDDADVIIEREGLKQMSDTGAIEAIVDEIIAANPAQVEQYRAGKDKVFGFFVGQVMKATQGKASPSAVNQLLKQKLK